MGHNNYQPDNWVIVHLKGDVPHYRVLAGWNGSYLYGDSWRMNSGITNAEEDHDAYRFGGTSGSWYTCRKRAYGLRRNNAYIWNQLQEKYGEKVEIMPEDTDWLAMDWILK